MHQDTLAVPSISGSSSTSGSSRSSSPQYGILLLAPEERARSRSTTPLTKKQMLKRARWLERQMPIPTSPEEVYFDPGGSIEKIGVMRPKEFWYWYHIADGAPVPGRAPWVREMGRVWGELWYDYLVSDELVLSGGIPLILQKRAQMIGKDDEVAIRKSELRALQVLQKRIGDLSTPAAIEGLVISICGRVQISIFQQEYEVARIHLGAVRKMLEFHSPSRAEWLCAVWSDLRVASTLGLPPVLKRSVPDVWKDQPPPPQNESRFQRLAMQNIRALNHVIGEDFAKIFGIFRRLHGLQARTQVGPIPIESYYHATYDCCNLHAKSRISEEQQLPDALAVETELLAICLKLATWEKASVCIPRGGEIERTLLDRAMYLLALYESPAKLKAATEMGANDGALVWMMFLLTATAYMFRRTMMPMWISHIQSITTASTPRAFQRALESWPSAPWWYSSAAHVICDMLAPTKGRWKVIGTEKEPVAEFVDGHRLKLIVIEE